MNPKNWNYTRKAVVATSVCVILLLALAAWTVRQLEHAKEAAIAPTDASQENFLRHIVAADAVHLGVQQIRIAEKSWAAEAASDRVEEFRQRADAAIKLAAALPAAAPVTNAVSAYLDAFLRQTTQADQLNEIQAKLRRSTAAVVAVIVEHDHESVHSRLMSIRRWEKDYYRTGGEIFHSKLEKDLAALTNTLAGILGTHDWVKPFSTSIEAYRTAVAALIQVDIKDEKRAAVYDTVRKAANKAEQIFGQQFLPAAAQLALQVHQAAQRWQDNPATANGDTTLATIAARVKEAGIPQDTEQRLHLAIDECRSAVAEWSAANGESLLLVKRVHEQAHQAEAAAHALATTARKAVPSIAALGETPEPAAAGNSVLTLILCTGGVVVSIVFLTGLNIRTNQRLSDALNRAISSLGVTSEEIDVASKQISSSSQSLADSASDQAASLEESSASLEETSSMTQRNAENAEAARRLSSETRQAADLGVEQVQQMSSAMDGIKASSDNISAIIKTIDEIAFQTNILALNAAVEAARAGEAGMGFAGVADEVRSLAQRCAKAATETAEIIEDSVGKNDQAIDISARVAEGLQQILDKASTVDELVSGIATASSEQSQGIQQIAKAISQLEGVTQNNAAGAEENASASHTLSTQATSLKSVVRELQGSADGIGGVEITPGSIARPTTLELSPVRSASLTSKPRNGGPVSAAANGKDSSDLEMDQAEAWFAPDESFELNSGNGNRVARL